MKHFISCDWGTTRFRLRLVESGSLRVLEEIMGKEGVASFPEGLSEGERQAAFEKFFRQSVLLLLKDYPDGVLPSCVISGMATSAMGWKKLPYAATPQPLDGSGLIYDAFDVVPGEERSLDVLLVSGLKTVDDVMRGEETELVGLGCLCPDWLGKESLMVVMPGTHSKQVELRSGTIHTFRTVMTGEFFSHLQSVPTLKMLFDGTSVHSMSAFDEGVRLALKEGALSSFFKIRSRGILGNLKQAETASFLSGLLIGDEWAGLARRHEGEFVIAAGESLGALYLRAASIAGIARVSATEPGLIRQAVMAGHQLLAQSWNARKSEEV